MLSCRHGVGLYSLLASFVGGRGLLGQQAATNSVEGVRPLIAAVESGAPQAWADALRQLAHQSKARPEEIRALVRLLSTPSANVRRRAAQAVGALGALAHPAVGSLVTLLRDPDSLVAREAAFALGTMHDRSEPVLRALFHAALDRQDEAAGESVLAISALGRYLLIPVSPEFATTIRQALTSSDLEARSLALRTAMRVDVPWAVSEFTRLLSDPSSDLRLDAAYALAGAGPSGRSGESTLRSLATDSVPEIRAEIPALLAKLGRPLPNRSAPDACSHRAGFGGVGPFVLSVASASGSLRGDGHGRFVGDDASTVVRMGTAFNFALPRAPQFPGPTPPRTPRGIDSSRYVVVDLSSPVQGSGATALPLVLDPSAQFHSFFMRDARGTVWNVGDIPVGATVKSDRTELSTTPIEIRRVSEVEFRFVAPPGSIARLWDWTRGDPPVNKGLYKFTFDLLLSARH